MSGKVHGCYSGVDVPLTFREGPGETRRCSRRKLEVRNDKMLETWEVWLSGGVGLAQEAVGAGSERGSLLRGDNCVTRGGPAGGHSAEAGSRSQPPLAEGALGLNHY